MDRVILTANEGMILTNGVTYGKRIILPVGRDGSEYTEITEARYNEIMSAKQVTDSEALNIILGGNTA